MTTLEELRAFATFAAEALADGSRIPLRVGARTVMLSELEPAAQAGRLVIWWAQGRTPIRVHDEPHDEPPPQETEEPMRYDDRARRIEDADIDDALDAWAKGADAEDIARRIVAMLPHEIVEEIRALEPAEVSELSR